MAELVDGLLGCRARGQGKFRGGTVTRDVTLDEDRSAVRTAAGPQIMASLRNLAITALRRRPRPRSSMRPPLEELTDGLGERLLLRGEVPARRK